MTLRARDVELMIVRSAAASASAQPFREAGWLLETKLDGYRALGERARDGAVTLISRGRHSLERQFPEVARALAALAGNFIVDGEICIVDGQGLPVFEQLRAGRNRAAGTRVVYFVFDLLARNGRDLRSQPLTARKAQLRKLIPPNSAVLGYVAHIADGGFEVYERAVAMGLEGIVAKRAASTYAGGKTYDWLKFKPAGYHSLGWRRHPHPLKTEASRKK